MTERLDLEWIFCTGTDTCGIWTAVANLPNGILVRVSGPPSHDGRGAPSGLTFVPGLHVVKSEDGLKWRTFDTALKVRTVMPTGAELEKNLRTWLDAPLEELGEVMP